MSHRPAVPGHYRTVVSDTELGGVSIPGRVDAGARVARREPRPRRVRRTPTTSISIGRTLANTSVSAGESISASAHAARAVEAKVAFEQLLGRTTSFSIDPGRPLHHHRSLMVRRLVELPLVLEPAEMRRALVLAVTECHDLGNAHPSTSEITTRGQPCIDRGSGGCAAGTAVAAGRGARGRRRSCADGRRRGSRRDSARRVRQGRHARLHLLGDRRGGFGERGLGDRMQGARSAPRTPRVV